MFTTEYRVENIAYYILYNYGNLNLQISSLRLQMLVYFVQVEFLFVKKKPCFNNFIETRNNAPFISCVQEVFENEVLYSGNGRNMCFDSYGDQLLVDSVINKTLLKTNEELLQIINSKDALIRIPQIVHL